VLAEGTNNTLTMDDVVYVRNPEYFLALQSRLYNTALEEFREYPDGNGVKIVTSLRIYGVFGGEGGGREVKCRGFFSRSFQIRYNRTFLFVKIRRVMSVNVLTTRFVK